MERAYIRGDQTTRFEVGARVALTRHTAAAAAAALVGAGWLRLVADAYGK